jgi:hypothetical protein
MIRPQSSRAVTATEMLGRLLTGRWTRAVLGELSKGSTGSTSGGGAPQNERAERLAGVGLKPGSANGMASRSRPWRTGREVISPF